MHITLSICHVGLLVTQDATIAQLALDGTATYMYMYVHM